MSKQAIVLNGLTKNYGKHRGINDLSFSVNMGEIFGFIGPNGAGKSTTIRTLMGLIRPTSGNASILGHDCQTQASIIAKDVGYLPSEDSYYENMKVCELLQYTADLYGMNCQTRLHELAERLNLDLSRRISDLSLGNRKKVGIVSALMVSPKLVIMDEPTSGLDPLIQQAFYEILKEENGHGTTIFLSSHVLSEVQKLCDRVAILKNGKLIGKVISFLSPYSYFSAADISHTGFYEWDYLVCYFILLIMFLLIAYNVFLRKDVQFRS